MNMFLPVLQLRSFDDVDPSSAINGSLELLSYALSLRYLILGNIHDDVWDARDFEVRHYQEPIRLFRGELTAAVRAYAPFRNLVAAEDSSSDSDYEIEPQFLGATLVAHIHRSLSHIQFDPVFPATATVLQLPAHLETLLPGTHAVFRQASRELAIVDETDPFHLRFPMAIGSMPGAVVRWYREMTFLFQSEPWYSLITHPRPFPPDTMNAAIRVTAEATLDRMDRRRYDYQHTCPAPPQVALDLLAQRGSEGPVSYASGVAYAILSEINTTVLPTLPQFLEYFARPASFLAGRAAVDSFMGLVVAFRTLLFHSYQPALATESGGALQESPPRELMAAHPVTYRAAQHLLIPLFPPAHHTTWIPWYKWIDTDDTIAQGPYTDDHRPESLSEQSRSARDFFDPLAIVFTAQSVLAHATAQGSARFPLNRVRLVIDALTIIDPRFSTQLVAHPHEAFHLSPDNQLGAMFNVILRGLHQANLTRDDLPLVGAVFSTIFRDPHRTVTLASFTFFLEPNDVVQLYSEATQLANDPAAAVYNTRILLLTAALRSIPSAEYSRHYSQLRSRYSRMQDYPPPAPQDAAAAAPGPNEHAAPQPDDEGLPDAPQ